jgi:hypothetical protein
MVDEVSRGSSCTPDEASHRSFLRLVRLLRLPHLNLKPASVRYTIDDLITVTEFLRLAGSVPLIGCSLPVLREQRL